MAKIVNVKFRKNNKSYYFDPGKFDLKDGDAVIVETARGKEYGLVSGNAKEIEDEKLTAQLKPVIRPATKSDTERNEENIKKEKEAFDVGLEKIAARGLEMKLVGVECAFDGSKMLFYFTADGRVDFRELVKDLAGIYRTRIELRQIGVRDETKAMGGIGVCGREFCCHLFQREFKPVSIKMAKDQNLSLNPTKIYGSCGRLMCCIRYEEETYRELSKNVPRVGDVTVTEDGLNGVVNSVNILTQKIRVLVDLPNDEKEMREYAPGELEFTKKSKKKPAAEKSAPANKEPAENAGGRIKGSGKEKSGKGRKSSEGAAKGEAE